MAFCAKCGATLAEGATFCAACGTPAGAAPAAQSNPLASNVAALLTYLGLFITGIIFLVIEPYKNDKFVRFHAFQSILLSVVYIGISIAWAIATAVLSAISLGVLWPVIALTWLLLRLAFFLLWLFLMYKAYQNERFMLPVIGPLAAEQAGK